MEAAMVVLIVELLIWIPEILADAYKIATYHQIMKIKMVNVLHVIAGVMVAIMDRHIQIAKLAGQVL